MRCPRASPAVLVNTPTWKRLSAFGRRAATLEDFAPSFYWMVARLRLFERQLSGPMMDTRIVDASDSTGQRSERQQNQIRMDAERRGQVEHPAARVACAGGDFRSTWEDSDAGERTRRHRAGAMGRSTAPLAHPLATAAAHRRTWRLT